MLVYCIDPICMNRYKGKNGGRDKVSKIKILQLCSTIAHL